MPPATVALADAIARTRSEGVPTVVVVTSTAAPRSEIYWRALNESSWVSARTGRVQLVKLPAEVHPALVQKLQVSTTPTIFVYERGAEGLVCRGSKAGGTPEDAIGWLDALHLADNRDVASTLDADVAPASFHGAPGYPSAQQPTPTYTAPQPTVPAAPTPMMAPVLPTYAAPAAPMMASPTAVVQIPGPNLVVQQGQPQVFLTQALPTAAAMPMMAAQPAAATFGNLFLPSAAPAAVPVPATMSMMAVPAAAPAAMVTAAPVAAAPTAAVLAPPVATAAMTSQTLAIPSSSSTRVRVRGNSLVRSALVRFGECLTSLNRARIESIQETSLRPQVQTGAGISTFSSTSAVPIAAPQATPVFAPQAAPPEYEYSPPPTVPSPQGTHHKHGHFFNKR